METKLFKTKKLAEEYIRENYSNATTKPQALSDRDCWDDVDMPDLQWSGETPGLAIFDDKFDEIDRVAWWEEGDDSYELYVGEKLTGSFDNLYDARQAYNKAVETEENKDEEEETVYGVKLLRNGEDISY